MINRTLTVVALALTAVACSKPTTEVAPAVNDRKTPSSEASDHAVDADGMAASNHSDDAPLPLPKRLAFMTGHVEAGLALFRAGEPKMAAKHLLHPVSETHAGERVGLDALGFEGEIFVAVSEALEDGVLAAQIEPQLMAAQANLEKVAARAGGDPADIIRYLMDTVIEEYSIGVRDGVVADMGEYQDAFGFTKVAINRAQSLDVSVRSSVIDALQRLLETWPAAPIPPDAPTSPAEIEDLVEVVRLSLTASQDDTPDVQASP